MLPLEIEEKKLNNLEKKVSILERLKGLDVDTKKLEASATELAETFEYLKIESAEKDLPEALTDNETVSDELIEEDIAEEETVN